MGLWLSSVSGLIRVCTRRFRRFMPRRVGGLCLMVAFGGLQMFVQGFGLGSSLPVV